MNELRNTLGMFAPLLFAIPFVHLVQSRYWSKQAKSAWAVVLVLGSILGYAAFLVSTFNKAKKQIKSFPSERKKETRILSASTFIVKAGRRVAIVAVIILTVIIILASRSAQLVLPWFYLAIFACWFPVELLGHVLLYFGVRRYTRENSANASP
jgi:hypothetical protein